MSDKRAKGRFYTLGNPFALRPFKQWAHDAGLPGATVLEPFAGANNIIETLQSLNLCGEFQSYDVSPASRQVRRRDTIQSFPKKFSACVTNPPWLARNSATRRGLPFPDTKYDNLYKRCLELCLDNCDFVAALVPASYLQSGLFRERLSAYMLLHDTLFSDTENPVCLSLFNDRTDNRTKVYYDDEFIAPLEELEAMIPAADRDKNVRFNDPEGDLGFISFDNTREPSIKFCCAKEIENYPIKVSSRFITRISGEFNNVPRLVRRLNKEITRFRRETNDLFLTPFKGLRGDGFYRRRMDFSLARLFINGA